MFRVLEFQTKVLERLDCYLEELVRQRNNANDIQQIIHDNPQLNIPLPNFVRGTIDHLRECGVMPQGHDQIPYEYLHREDGCGRPVPNVTLKVPTAGGKTYLAVRSIERILSSYHNSNTGLVLWVVPNEAIYTQTLQNLNDREHVYRQTLENAAAGNVMILEKNSPLHAADVESNLCIMLIMIQSINRRQAIQLTAFRDRGDVHDFFPAEGEMEAHANLHECIPNLDVYNHGHTLIRQSLGNVMRVRRPIVVIDEGHRATSPLANEVIYGLNPSFVLELTATPKNRQPRGGATPQVGRYANVLVEINGKEVDDEGMIKMPINLNPMQGEDWIATLSASLQRLNDLDAISQGFRAESGRYIRPIMLVQVERTGADQIEAGHIHSEDVRDQLLQFGLQEEEIAIKTAEINDLSNPENQNLLSDENRIRVIITKQALQEGWNCPFAYVICALAATTNLSGMTQLIGRILRLPDASKTEVEQLDQCYIYTHQAETAQVIEAVRQSLDKAGLGDLALHIEGNAQAPTGHPKRELNRRDRFVNTDIYLPQVMSVSEEETRLLDYDTDILAQIDWSDFDSNTLIEEFPNNAQPPDNQLRRLEFNDNGGFVLVDVGANQERRRFNPVYVSRAINDIVLNSFVAYEIVNNIANGLAERGDISEEYLGQQSNLLVEMLRSALRVERDQRAETIFRNGLALGTIQFRLRADGANWLMPHIEETNHPEVALPLLNNMLPITRSLFESVYQADLNPDEQTVALSLEREETIQWWHRNVARHQYGIQGWRRNKMYPDFLFGIQRQNGAISSIRILETKGDQLDNLDTAYKRSVMETLTEHFSFEAVTDVGQCIIQDEEVSVDARLILFGEIAVELPNWINEAE
jgi:type III restriction enzyme